MLCCGGPVRIRPAVNQRPRTILSSVSAAPTGIMLPEPPGQIISVTYIEFLCLKAFKYINIIHHDNHFNQPVGIQV